MSGGSEDVRTRPHKPIWGFGWAGWCLLAVAVALGGAWAAGVDLRYLLLSAIARVFGGDAVVWFASNVIGGHWLDFGFLEFGMRSAPLPRFGLAAMVFVLVGMQVHPRRFGRVRVVAVVLLGLTGPLLAMQIERWLWRFAVLPGAFGYTYESALCGLWSWMIASALCGVVLGWAIRSVRWGMVIGLWCSSGAWLIGELGLSMAGESAWLVPVAGHEFWFMVYSWLWSPAILAGLLWWAIGARLGESPAWACPSCGYDLRGLGDRCCPECGGSVAVAGDGAPRTLGA